MYYVFSSDYRKGSLDVQTDVLLPSTTDVTTDFLNSTVQMIVEGDSIVIDGMTGQIQSIGIDNSKLHSFVCLSVCQKFKASKIYR